MYHNCLKRIIYFFASAFLLVALSPLILAVALLIWWKSGRPIIFRQQRVGRKGKTFWLYKFRSMKVGAEQMEDEGIPKKELINPEARILRMLFLDELPQLWNVFRGEMSLVGPRPLPKEEWQQHLKFNPEYEPVLSNKPGMTGLNSVLCNINEKRTKHIMGLLGLKMHTADEIGKKYFLSVKKNHKVSGSYFKLIEEREFYYLKHESLALDLMVMWWTFLLVLERSHSLIRT